MQSIFIFLLTLMLAFWGTPSLAQLETHEPATEPHLFEIDQTTNPLQAPNRLQRFQHGIESPKATLPHRPIYLQIWDSNLGDETYLLGLHTGVPGQDSIIYLRDDQQFYHIDMPISDEYELSVNDFVGQIEHVSEDPQAPLFIAIHHPDLLPYGLTVWTESEVLEHGRANHISVKGYIPMIFRDQVYLHMPFHAWPGTPQTIKAQVKADEEDWQRLRYEVSGELAGESLVFLQIGDAYFPIIMANETGKEQRMDFVSASRGSGVKVDPTFLLEMEEHHRHDVKREFASQAFLDALSNQKGMTKYQYEQFVQAIPNQKRRDQLLQNWAAHLAQFQPTYPEEGDFRPVIRVFNGLAADPWVNVFRRSFHEFLHEMSDPREQSMELGANVLITAHVVGIGLMLVLIVVFLVRPNRGLTTQLAWAEGFLLTTTSLLVAVTMLVDYDRDGIWRMGSVGDWLIWLVSISAAIVTLRYILPDLFDRVHRGRFFIHLALLIVAVVLAILYYELSNRTDQYLLRIYDQYVLLGWNRYTYWHRNEDVISIPPLTIIGTLIYGTIRHFLVKRMPKLQRRNESLNAELTTLKTQLSPHFFFNSLNTVYSFSLEEDSPRTSEALTRLSDLMRFVIYQADKEAIPLEQEIDYLTDYVELQQLRLDPNQHEVHFRVDGEAGDLQIAPLLLITLIENAFKHGISMSEPSFIRIDLLIQAKGLILTIENSNHAQKALPVPATDTLAGGLGLANTRRRLDLLYAGRYDWVIETEDDHYLTRLCLDLA